MSLCINGKQQIYLKRSKKNLDANKISEIEIFGNKKLFLRVPLEIDYILPWIKCLPCK